MEPVLSDKEKDFAARALTANEEILKENNQSIGTHIEQNAEKIPDKTALFYGDDSWTWNEFNRECNKIANYFLEKNLKPGDTIALMLENSPETLLFLSGLNKIQGISALININQKKQALVHAFTTVNSKYIVVDGDTLSSFTEIVDQLPLKRENIFVVNNPKNIPHDFIDLPDEIESKSISIANPNTTFNSILRETIAYIFSSGTTGLPKAIIMYNLRFFTQTISTAICTGKLTQEDVIYITMPLYHNVAIGIQWTAAVLTGAAVALRKRLSASKFWDDVRKYKVTFTMYVGEVLRYILNQPESENDRKHTLKKISGLGLRKGIWEKFQSRFGIEEIYEFYGLTEGAGGALNVVGVPGMIGRKLEQNLELAKVNQETGELYKDQNGFCIKCKVGEIGMALNELNEDILFTGYKDKEKTKKKYLFDVFVKGDKYFNTGDMLKLHEDQWLSFVDRFGDTFRWKGENVSTLEVENILNSYKSITGAAVYGVTIPNTGAGKAGMASIKLHLSVKFDIDDFSKFVLEVLPGYSIPVFVRIKKELEVTGPYKIKKVNLRKEGYNIEKIIDKIFFWDSTIKKYIPLDSGLSQKINDGKIKI
jgi:citronellyl-CoA synthetase